eukprot:gene4725-biopygen5272
MPNPAGDNSSTNPLAFLSRLTGKRFLMCVTWFALCPTHASRVARYGGFKPMVEFMQRGYCENAARFHAPGRRCSSGSRISGASDVPSSASPSAASGPSPARSSA